MPLIYIRRDLSLVTLVDEEDYPFLVQWTWGLQVDNRGKNYVRRYICKQNLYLHRVIMRRMCPAPSEAHRYVDHINGDGLDNRRENLRWATASENAKNTPRLRAGLAMRAATRSAALAIRDSAYRSGERSQPARFFARDPLEIPGFGTPAGAASDRSSGS
jgi:hypothetical protein